VRILKSEATNPAALMLGVIQFDRFAIVSGIAAVLLIVCLVALAEFLLRKPK
jgi:hypothetical protein